jgi:hypothetical protein
VSDSGKVINGWACPKEFLDFRVYDEYEDWIFVDYRYVPLIPNPRMRKRRTRVPAGCIVIVLKERELA